MPPGDRNSAFIVSTSHRLIGVERGRLSGCQQFFEFQQAPLKQRQATLESDLPRDKWRGEPPQKVAGQGRL
jgi:hypothetical protein